MEVFILLGIMAWVWLAIWLFGWHIGPLRRWMYSDYIARYHSLADEWHASVDDDSRAVVIERFRDQLAEDLTTAAKGHALRYGAIVEVLCDLKAHPRVAALFGAIRAREPS